MEWIIFGAILSLYFSGIFFMDQIKTVTLVQNHHQAKIDHKIMPAQIEPAPVAVDNFIF